MRSFDWYPIEARSGVESWKIAYFARMKPLEGLLILSRQNKNHGNIYKKEKGRRWARGLMLGKIEAGRDFQFLEVMGTNVLTDEVVWHCSNLTAKECWESAKRVLRANHALGGINHFNSSEHLP